MRDVNWLVTILLGALLSIPFGILTNAVTSRAQYWIDKRALSSRGKSLELLKDEYRRVAVYHADWKVLNLALLHNIVVALWGICIAISIGIFAFFAYMFVPKPDVWYFYVLLVVSCGSIFWIFNTLIRTLDRIANDVLRLLNFTKYETQTKARIKELEAALKKSRGAIK